MRLVKYTHACVRVEHGGAVLVIDPGVWSEPEALLVPVHASWLKLAEAIGFVRPVGPQRAHGIHDAQINERGLGSVTAWLAEEAGCGYRHLAPGEAA